MLPAPAAKYNVISGNFSHEARGKKSGLSEVREFPPFRNSLPAAGRQRPARASPGRSRSAARDAQERRSSIAGRIPADGRIPSTGFRLQGTPGPATHGSMRHRDGWGRGGDQKPWLCTVAGGRPSPARLLCAALPLPQGHPATPRRIAEKGSAPPGHSQPVARPPASGLPPSCCPEGAGPAGSPQAVMDRAAFSPGLQAASSTPSGTGNSGPVRFEADMPPDGRFATPLLSFSRCGAWKPPGLRAGQGHPPVSLKGPSGGASL